MEILTGLTIKRGIAVESFFEILSKCQLLRRLSVLVLWQLSQSPPKNVEVPCLEYLFIQTAVEPGVIIDHLHLYKLRSLHLEWVLSHESPMPRNGDIDLRGLVERPFEDRGSLPSAHFQSLSLVNIMANEKNVIDCLRSPHVSDNLEELVIRNDTRSTYLKDAPLLQGRKITSQTLNLLTEAVPLVPGVCPLIKNLELSCVDSQDGEFSRMVVFRSQAPTVFRVSYRFYSSERDHLEDEVALSRLVQTKDSRYFSAHKIPEEHFLLDYP